MAKASKPQHIFLGEFEQLGEDAGQAVVIAIGPDQAAAIIFEAKQSQQFLAAFFEVLASWIGSKGSPDFGLCGLHRFGLHGPQAGPDNHVGKRQSQGHLRVVQQFKPDGWPTCAVRHSSASVQ